jgi:fructosamine-3-kinase
MVHRCTGVSFGWRRDNLLGRLPQDNSPTADWAAFFADRSCGRSWTPPRSPIRSAHQVRARLEAGIERHLGRLLDHEPSPSVVHGDLWPGNVVDGRWLIDPAVHYADREYGLAVTALFGGVPGEMRSAYAEAWPLPEGFRRRRPALQLPHMLAHVKMFGGGWVGAVVGRLDALGW